MQVPLSVRSEDILSYRQEYPEVMLDRIGEPAVERLMLLDFDLALSKRLAADPGIHIIGPVKWSRSYGGYLSGEFTTVTKTVRRVVARLPDWQDTGEPVSIPLNRRYFEL